MWFRHAVFVFSEICTIENFICWFLEARWHLWLVLFWNLTCVSSSTKGGLFFFSTACPWIEPAILVCKIHEVEVIGTRMNSLSPLKRCWRYLYWVSRYNSICHKTWSCETAFTSLMPQYWLSFSDMLLLYAHCELLGQMSQFICIGQSFQSHLLRLSSRVPGTQTIFSEHNFIIYNNNWEIDNKLFTA